MFNMFSFSRSPRNQSNPSRKFGKKRTYKYPAKSAKKVLPTIAEEDYNLDPQPQSLSEEPVQPEPETWEEADLQVSCQVRQENPAYHCRGELQLGASVTEHSLRCYSVIENS